MKIGYARVSREDQNLTRQIEALEAEGCERIFAEKIGGSLKSRPELDKMLEVLRPGDCVTVQKLDRLGRGFIHLNSLLEWFDKEGIFFKSLGDNFDTSSPIGRALLRIMTVIAELEKDTIRERTKDALASAKRNGKVLGAPLKDFSEEVQRFKELEDRPREEVMKVMGITEYKYYALRKRSKAPEKLEGALNRADTLK